MSRLSRTACAALGAAALVTAASAGSALAAPSGPHALPGSVPSWAVAKNRAASTDSTQQVTFRVYLNYRGGDAAAAYASSVSTPGSANYKKFLTPAQFRAQFSPAQADVNSVSRGSRARASPSAPPRTTASTSRPPAPSPRQPRRSTPPSRSTAPRARRCAATPLRSRSRPASPRSRASSGSTSRRPWPTRTRSRPGPALFRNAQPTSDYWGQKTVQNTPTPDGTALPSSPSAFAPKGYAGAQLQGLYGMTGAIGSGNDGHGVTVGIIDAYASPTILQDANTYSAAHGLPSLNGHFTQVVAPGTYNRPENPKQDPQGWAGEETLDVEAVHTMAPGADITYIGAPNNYRDMDAIMNRVVDNTSPTSSPTPTATAARPSRPAPSSRRWTPRSRPPPRASRCSSPPATTPTRPAASPAPARPGLAGLEPLRHGGRWHQRWCLAVERPGLRARLGDGQGHAEQGHDDVEHPCVPLRQRRWHLAAVRPAVLPGRVSSPGHLADLRRRRDARGA